jgi:SAM-dependent methyltransferase
LFEASKTKKLWGPETLALLDGKGLDIGCGPDPITTDVDRFDIENGDANFISRYVTNQYDFIFSSHCLEHMHDPRGALREWFSLLKPAGHLIVVVPDEDLYEQGYFPSLFNGDHKVTFTIRKATSWSQSSINVLDMVNSLSGAEVVSVELQDNGYDRRLLQMRTSPWARKLWNVFLRIKKYLPAGSSHVALAYFLHALGAVIDQTQLPGDRLAQIQFILRKSETL